MTKVIASVTNDLITDQRAHKVCSALKKAGFDVVLVGRKFKAPPLPDLREYQVKLLKFAINKGPLFYAAYNIRLFFFLLFNKADILIANDLDTLPANYIASKIKGCKIIYDTHEYFCHVPELSNRPLVKAVWQAIEGFIFPKLKYVMTVNDTLAALYSEKYKVKVHVVKNIPRYNTKELQNNVKTKEELGLPTGKKIIIYQGAVNVDRGLEEAILAMHYLDDAVLLIIGGGDVLQKLKDLCNSKYLNGKVFFTGKIPFQQLGNYTICADLGIALEKNTNLNYKYSLSNKIFDYINAGIPILASSLPEVKSLFAQFQIGTMIQSHDPAHIAEKMDYMLHSKDEKLVWKSQLKRASESFKWEDEEKKLMGLIIG